MALFEDKCYGCICDGCGEHFEERHTGFTIFADEQQLRESLDENGWHQINGKWYCPDCCTYDEEKEEYLPSRTDKKDIENYRKISNEVLHIIQKEYDYEATLQTVLRNDLSFDSLDAIELSMLLEREFNIAIPVDDINSFGKSTKVQDVVDYIARRTIHESD